MGLEKKKFPGGRGYVFSSFATKLLMRVFDLILSIKFFGNWKSFLKSDEESHKKNVKVQKIFSNNVYNR